jgi:hypothetical protein
LRDGCRDFLTGGKEKYSLRMFLKQKYKETAGGRNSTNLHMIVS